MQNSSLTGIDASLHLSYHHYSNSVLHHLQGASKFVGSKSANTLFWDRIEDEDTDHCR